MWPTSTPGSRPTSTIISTVRYPMSEAFDFVIYKSGHPDVLAAWVDYEAAYLKWCDDIVDQIKAWGFDPEKNKPFVSNSAWSAATLTGLSWQGERWNSEPPQYWKWPKEYKNQGVIDPYWSKPKGSLKVQKQFKALTRVPDIRRDLVALGMPHHQFTGLAVTTYAAHMVTTPGGPSAVWIKWHNCPDPLASSQWWEPVKLTEYYALVEEGKDPFKKDEPETTDD